MVETVVEQQSPAVVVAAAATPSKKVRGKNKNPSHRRDPDAPKAVIELVPVADARIEHELAALFQVGHSLETALIRDVQVRCKRFWADEEGRKNQPWRELAAKHKLSQKHLEQTIWAHLDRASWMKAHVSKALAMYLAGRVWASTERHLFGDETGKRSGPLRIKPFHEFTSIPGGARSPNPATPNKWETFKLAGTLQGHLDTYKHPGLPAGISVDEVCELPPGTPVLAQPRLLQAPEIGRSWTAHTGALAVHFTGGPTRSSARGTMIIPVRLPGGAGRWNHLSHFLNDPSVWRKLTLVRHQDPSRSSGWRYEFHLLVEKPGYLSENSRQARKQTPQDRLAVVDVNVSNLSITSAPVDETGAVDLAGLRTTVIVDSAAESERLAQQRVKAGRAAKARDRSRRATNARQYEKSKAQQKRDTRREKQNLRPAETPVPAGARKLKEGLPHPAQPYHQDTVSKNYLRIRAGQAESARAASEAKHNRANERVREAVLIHGVVWRREQAPLPPWAKLWGKGVAGFAPGMFTAGLDAHCQAVGGKPVQLIGTHHTALSQYCPCGTRVVKELQDRQHTCPVCGLRGTRDLVSALGGLFLHFDPEITPGSARRDPDMARAALAALSTVQKTRLEDACLSETHPLADLSRPAGAQAGQDARTAGTGSRLVCSGNRVDPGPGEALDVGGESGRGPHLAVTNRRRPNLGRRRRELRVSS